MKNLLARLGRAEDGLTERKPEGVNAAEIRRTLVAFANSTPEGGAGVLFIGVHDKGTIVGVTQENIDKLQKTVREQAEKVCYPSIDFQSEVLTVDGKSILAIVVPASKNRPHFSGPAFVRRGSESVTASAEVFDEIVASRNSKVAAILRMRNIPTITIRFSEPPQLSDRHLAPKMPILEWECVVQSCDAHKVDVFFIADNRHASYPLDTVAISHDHRRYRPMLQVKI